MSNILCQCQQMSRSCGLLTSRKGESRSKSLDKLASANCRTTVCQLVYDRPPIGVRPYGNCRSTVWQLPYDNLSRDLWQLSPFPIWVHRMFCQPTDLSFVTAFFVSAVFAIWLLPNLSIGDGREPAAAATDGARAMLSPHSHTSDKNFVVVGTTVFLVWICQDR